MANARIGYSGSHGCILRSIFELHKSGREQSALLPRVCLKVAFLQVSTDSLSNLECVDNCAQKSTKSRQSNHPSIVLVGDALLCDVNQIAGHERQLVVVVGRARVQRAALAQHRRRRRVRRRLWLGRSWWCRRWRVLVARLPRRLWVGVIYM